MDPRLSGDETHRVSLAYAAEHLEAAARALAVGEQPLADRLQDAWTDHVQMVWMKPCLTVDLLRDFKSLWERYTAPSDDKHNTVLRALAPDELIAAVTELVDLAFRTAIGASRPEPHRLATMADLT